MKNNWVISALISAALFAIGIFIGMNIKPNTPSTSKPEGYESIIKIDTVYKFVRTEPVVIYKTKTKVIKISDTIVKAYPFVAKLDTIVNKDTVSAEFEFPQNLMSVRVSRKPDTLAVEKVIVRQYIEKERSWWEVPVFVLSGAILGFLFGSMSK